MDLRDNQEFRGGGRSFPGGRNGFGEPTMAPNCYLCANYYITWDSSMPYGCKAFEFKSKTSPALEVFRASGNHCMAFQLKKGVPLR